MAVRTWSGSVNANFNNTGNWVEGAVPTNADDVVFSTNNNMTINVASTCHNLNFGTYTGLFTISTTNNLVVTGNLTLSSAGMTFSNTGSGAVSLAPTGGSGSVSIVCSTQSFLVNVQFNGTNTYTLSGGNNFIIKNFSGSGTPITINTTTTEQLEVKGNFTSNGGGGIISGTATLLFSGSGTWSAGGAIQSNLIINTSGTINITGPVAYNTGTFTYTAGTITTSGQLNIGANTTWNNVGNIPWTNVSLSATTQTINTTPFTMTGTLTLAAGTTTFSGTAGFSISNFSSSSAGANYVLKNGNTYTVNGNFSFIGTNASHITIKSDSTGSIAYLNVTSRSTVILALYCNATDIDSSGGQNINQYGGTISASCVNWDTLSTFQWPAQTNISLW